MLKLIYTFFLGLILATFVGVGIAAFYPAPKAPDYPAISVPKAPSTDVAPTPSPAEIKFQQDQKDYQTEFALYNRNVSLAAIAFAIVFVIVSLAFASRLDILSDGLLLGGVFALTYSIIRGFMANDNIYRFLLVTVGLIIALILGYVKFIKPHDVK